MSVDEQLCCVTLDLENNWQPPRREFDYETFEHLDRYVSMMKSLDVPVTVFVVGEVLEDRPEAVEVLRSNLDVEFHLHSYYHDLDDEVSFQNDLDLGVDAFETFFGRRPTGYRAPMGNIDERDLVTLESTGFEFDSSVFPSYRPGLFNNLDKPLTPYVPSSCTDLLELPVGAVKYLRIPIAHSYIKLLGRSYLRALRRAPLPDVVTVGSHLQDFFRTEMHDRLDQPLRFIHNRNVHRSIPMFEELIRILRNRGFEFVTASTVIEREHGRDRRRHPDGQSQTRTQDRTR